MPIVAIERKKIARYEAPTHPAPAKPIASKRQAVIMCHLRSWRLSDEKPQPSRPIVPTTNGIAERTPVAKVDPELLHDLRQEERQAVVRCDSGEIDDAEGENASVEERFAERHPRVRSLDLFLLALQLGDEPLAFPRFQPVGDVWTISKELEDEERQQDGGQRLENEAPTVRLRGEPDVLVHR